MNYLGAGSAASVSSSNGFNELFSMESARGVKAAGGNQDSSRAGGGRVRRISLNEYKDRVYGSWLGSILGTVFGFPFEGEPKNVVDHLDHYLLRRTGAPYKYSYAPVDDDYYYEMVALYGFERHGIEMTVEQLGEMWKEYQAGTWGSSEMARLLLEKGIKAPHTGEPRYNRWFHTVGPQFSSDLYGMITPGMINLAGSTARKYSHVNGYAEGSDGAVFVVGCVSEAFFETDIAKIVQQAASLISPKSNYRKGLDQVLAGYTHNEDWRQLADAIEDRWRPDYPQINNSVANGALVALALLYGRGDYLNSLNIVTSTDDYTDADCNADNVGSVLGAMHGVKAIPKEMVAALNDRIYGKSMGSVTYKKVVDERISDLAERIATVGKRLLIANGAVEIEGFLLIPQEMAKEQPLEWFDINDYGKLWGSAWNLAHAGRGDTGENATYLQWEDNTLVTFPRDTRPCRLERKAHLPSGHPALALSVGCIPGQPWRLQARVNNEILVHEVISTDVPSVEPQYRKFHLDLSKYAGQTVNLRLYQWYVNGKAPGSAYWQKAEIHEI
jgi:hypothetical protein